MAELVEYYLKFGSLKLLDNLLIHFVVAVVVIVGCCCFELLVQSKLLIYLVELV